MNNILEKNSGFLELLLSVDKKIQLKLIKNATNEEIESILDCFVNVVPYEDRFKNCLKKFQKFRNIFKRRRFSVKKARLLFQKNLTFVSSVISTILSEYLNSDVTLSYECE